MTEPSEKLRILFGVAESSARGGINACEPPFISAVRGSGPEVFEATYLFDNRDGTSLSKRMKQVSSAASVLKRVASSESVDVIHLNTSFEARSLLRDAFTLFMLGRRRVFLKFHGSNTRLFRSRSPLVRVLIAYVTRKAAGMGVLSRSERDAFVEAGVAPEKVFTVKNAVEALACPPMEAAHAKPAKLLFVSRLVSTKGLEDTVTALKMVIESGGDATLDVLGTGEAREPAERIASRLGIADKIRFHGHLPEENVREFYASSDILVFPTFHDEGFPMVVFGALRFGLPVVTTRIRAMADYLREDENCLFCEARNPESIAAAIGRLMGDRRLVGRLRENNLMLSRDFLPDRVASEYLEIYRRLCGTPD